MRCGRFTPTRFRPSDSLSSYFPSLASLTTECIRGQHSGNTRHVRRQQQGNPPPLTPSGPASSLGLTRDKCWRSASYGSLQGPPSSLLASPAPVSQPPCPTPRPVVRVAACRGARSEVSR
jgi:hypothetical protein